MSNRRLVVGMCVIGIGLFVAGSTLRVSQPASAGVLSSEMMTALTGSCPTYSCTTSAPGTERDCRLCRAGSNGWYYRCYNLRLPWPGYWGGLICETTYTPDSQCEDDSWFRCGGVVPGTGINWWYQDPNCTGFPDMGDKGFIYVPHATGDPCN
jgi:hypothetical protein